MAKRKTTKKPTTTKRKAVAKKTTRPKAKTAAKTARKVTKKAPIRKTVKKPVKKVAAKKAAPKKATARKTAPRPQAAKAQPQTNTQSTANQNWQDLSNFTQLNDMFKNPMEDIMPKGSISYEKLTEEATNASRETMDDCMKSTSIFAKGCEELFRASIAMAQTTAEKNAEFMKQAMTTRSINDFSTMQNTASQKGYEEMMAEATKLSELSMKVMTDAAEPINEQMNKAVQKASKAMAA